MNGAIALGPLLLPAPLLLALAAAGSALALGRWLGRRAGVDVAAVLWPTLGVAVLFARLGFVWQFRGAYGAAPLDILDLRDGGWNPMIGLVAAWFYALHRLRRQPALGRPLRHALLAGTVVWAAGSIALALDDDGRRLPALTLASIDEGGQVPLERFAGRPTVVNLWATWCGPCVREMPVLQAAQAGRPDVHFVFVNQGESAAQVGGWLQRRQLALRNVLLDGKGLLGAAFDVQGYPTTLFFDAGGRLVERRIGELSTATLQQRLDAVAPR